MNERLAKEFVNQGHEVEIITFSLQYPSILFPGKSQFDDRPKPAFKISRMLSSVNPLTWIKVGRYIRKMAPDLVIVKYWIPFMAPAFGTALRIAKKNGYTKVVSILDNIIPHEQRPFDFQLSQFFVKPVDGFITLSQSVLDDLGKFDQNKPRKFSPHPIYDHFGEVESKDVARAKIGLNKDGKYLLFFGFIRDYKGLDILLKAMSDPRIRQAGIRCIVAGEYYANQADYERLIRELDISNTLDMFTEFIPDNEIPNYFNAADCVVQPYKTATQSGVTQIAYHFEKPMIVTNVGGLPEIVPHGEVGFVAKVNPTSLADQILAFYAGDTDRFSSNIRAKQKEYSWTTMLNNVLSLID